LFFRETQIISFRYCSTGVALFAGGWALAQLWLFWVAPIIGAIIGGIVYRFLARERNTMLRV
jgi:aquaporin Z